MTALLQRLGPSFAAVIGLFLVVLAFIVEVGAYLVVGGVFFGAAIIAAQLARLTTGEQQE